MDSCKTFNEPNDTRENICKSNNIEIPIDDSIRGKRKRNSFENITLSLKQSFKGIYDKIIDIYVQEIQERFKKSNLVPVLELFNLIMINDEKMK